MVRWWEENGPPVYISVASYLGLVKAKPTGSKGSSSFAGKKDPGDLEELERMFSGSGGFF